MSDCATPRHIVILGLMGVGKSTTGRAVASLLEWPYSDSDAEIEALTGQPGRAFAAHMGVSVLHELEAALLIGALARPEPHVITAAASIVENGLASKLLDNAAFVVRLQASLEVTIQRQADGDHRRAMDLQELAALAARREPMFAAVEDLVLDAGRSTDDLARAIIDASGSKGCRAAGA